MGMRQRESQDGGAKGQPWCRRVVVSAIAMKASATVSNLGSGTLSTRTP